MMSEWMLPAGREHKASSRTPKAFRQYLEEQCFDAWAEHHRNFADRKRGGHSVLDQTWKLSDWTVDCLQIRRFSTGAEEVIRRHEHVRRSFSEHLAIYVSFSGRRHVIVGDDVLSMQPDRIQIHDLNLPSHYSTPCSVSALVIDVPYSAIGYDPSSHPATMSVATDTPVGMLLQNAIMTIYSQAATISSSEAPKLAAGFCGLLLGMIQTERADVAGLENVANARLQLIKTYIEMHIDDPELDTTLLCRKFAASRATIYRLFAADGGVKKYLTQRRLVHAFRRLRSSPPSRGRIRTVAEALGFDDHSHFNRLFRKKFCMSPSDAMGIWQAQISKPDHYRKPDHRD